MNGTDNPESGKHESGHRTDLPFIPNSEERPPLTTRDQAVQMTNKTLAETSISVGRAPSNDELSSLNPTSRTKI